VPLAKVVQIFAGDSLQASFEKGTANLNAEVSLIGYEQLSVRSPGADTPLFALQGVHMKAKPGAKIAGFEGEQFCRAVNEVGDLEVKDLEIGGTIFKPEFKWGKSIQELVVSGGKAFAKKEAEKAAEKGAQKVQAALDKELKKNPQLKNALPEGFDAKKAVKEGSGGVLDGLFGKKKPQEKPAEKPADAPKSQ